LGRRAGTWFSSKVVGVVLALSITAWSSFDTPSAKLAFTLVLKQEGFSVRNHIYSERIKEDSLSLQSQPWLMLVTESAG